MPRSVGQVLTIFEVQPTSWFPGEALLKIFWRSSDDTRGGRCVCVVCAFGAFGAFGAGFGAFGTVLAMSPRARTAVSARAGGGVSVCSMYHEDHSTWTYG